MSLDAAVAARLKEMVGTKGFSEDPQEIAPHLVEWRGKYRGRSDLLLKPQSTAEVSRLLAICNETRTPVVPQGGNTGLVGGQIPFDGEVVLSTTRMNRIRHLDPGGLSVIADAGVVLTQMQRAADDVNRYFPLSLASEGSCTIGGNVSTNAGGVNVLRYGSMRELVLGLQVVLADGRVLDSLRTVRKDNTGYDLKQLFIGAEGTLGIVTAAALKLFPKPLARATALVAVPDVTSAISLLHRMQEATGGLVSAFELISRAGLDMVLAHIPQTRDPLARRSPWYVLLDVESGAKLPLRDIVENALAEAAERSPATDAVLADSEAQRAHLWRLRESLSEAQKHEGGSIKHDISVPIAAIPEFLERGIAAAERLMPGIRPVPFGHLGDGNIHFNFSVPQDGDNGAFLARWDDLNRVVHNIVHDFGGSISAEHGIGVLKREEIGRYKSPAEMETMRALKRTLDPNNILNPGKVISL
ncbi:MAG TPA: FAD-binding oxidoreductase [Rhizomicrobium sp.]|nr:FAD-binding oxidoreductase [Rhizomicrobium sp.]